MHAASVFRCVSITPLGSPVDPEVYTMAARSMSMQLRAGGASRPAPTATSQRTARGSPASSASSMVPETITRRNDRHASAGSLNIG